MKKLSLALLFSLSGFLALAAMLPLAPKSPCADCGEKPVTYQDIKPILADKCDNCHNGVLAPDFSTYETMKPSVEEGAFEIRVFMRKDMPISVELTEEEMRLLQCWVSTGALEK